MAEISEEKMSFTLGLMFRERYGPIFPTYSIFIPFSFSVSQFFNISTYFDSVSINCQQTINFHFSLRNTYWKHVFSFRYKELCWLIHLIHLVIFTSGSCFCCSSETFLSQSVSPHWPEDLASHLWWWCFSPPQSTPTLGHFAVSWPFSWFLLLLWRSFSIGCTFCIFFDF